MFKNDKFIYLSIKFMFIVTYVCFFAYLVNKLKIAFIF